MKKVPKNFFFNEIFEQCHSAEKCKRGTLCDFLTSIVLQNIETNEGGPSGAIQKTSKKHYDTCPAKVESDHLV